MLRIEGVEVEEPGEGEVRIASGFEAYRFMEAGSQVGKILVTV